MKRRSLPDHRFYPDSTAMASTIFLQTASPMPVPLYSSIVCRLEDDKNPIEVFQGYADPVIRHRKNPFAGLLLCRDVDAGGSLAVELDRIDQQVLK